MATLTGKPSRAVLRLLAACWAVWGFAAPKDVRPEAAEAARTFAPFGGPVAWESAADIEAADPGLAKLLAKHGAR